MTVLALLIILILGVAATWAIIQFIDILCTLKPNLFSQRKSRSPSRTILVQCEYCKQFRPQNQAVADHSCYYCCQEHMQQHKFEQEND